MAGKFNNIRITRKIRHEAKKLGTEGGNSLDTFSERTITMIAI